MNVRGDAQAPFVLLPWLFNILNNKAVPIYIEYSRPKGERFRSRLLIIRSFKMGSIYEITAFIWDGNRVNPAYDEKSLWTGDSFIKGIFKLFSFKGKYHCLNFVCRWKVKEEGR